MVAVEYVVGFAASFQRQFYARAGAAKLRAIISGASAYLGVHGAAYAGIRAGRSCNLGLLEERHQLIIRRALSIQFDDA